MSFTFGFYNSIEHDRLYDAIQVSKIFDGIILDGVYATVGDAFIVQASDEENVVVVGPGRAWFNHTWNENDGYLELELEPAETVLKRIDAIVIDVDERVQNRKNDILILKGIPSSNPVNPPLVNELEHHQYPLCYILRNEAQQVVGQAQITNMVGTSDCPFVTGVLEGLDVDLMLLQWRAAWAEFIQACQDHIDEWEDAVKEDVATFVNAFKIQCNEFVTETAAWQTIQKESFTKFYNDFKTQSILYTTEYTEWVDSLKEILDEDALGHVLLEMSKIEKEVRNQVALMEQISNGFVPKKTQFLTNGDILVTYPDESTIKTVFQTNGDISETLASKDGVVGVEKLTIFKSDSEILEKVIGGKYQDYIFSSGKATGQWVLNAYDLVGTNLPKPASPFSELMRDSLVWPETLISNELVWESLTSSEAAVDIFLSNNSNGFRSAVNKDAYSHAIKTLLLKWWDKTIAVDWFINKIVNTRSLLQFIFDDEVMREKFTENPVLMNTLITGDLSQLGIFCVSAAKENNLSVIKNLSSSNQNWDIHSYKWAVFFGGIKDGLLSPSGAERCYIDFYPLGTETPVYHWEYDPGIRNADGYSLDIPNPVLVNIAGGAYSYSTRRMVDTGALSTSGVNALVTCVAF